MAVRVSIMCLSQRAQRSKKFDLARNFRSRSKFLISLENVNLDVSASPQKIGPLENFILDRNFQSRPKSRIFLIFGPSGFSCPNILSGPGVFDFACSD